MQSTQSTTSSTLAPHIPIPHDLPALPGSPLAELQARIDLWDTRIPTAAPAPVRVTAAEVREQLATTNSDWDNKPILPPFPGQRRSPEQPPKVPGQRSSVYDDVVLGDRYNDNFANGCF